MAVVAACDDLEQEVGVAAVVREVADLVDAEEARLDVATKAATESNGRFLSGEIAEHVARGCEANGVSAEGALVREVSEEHGFADAVGAEQNGVDAFLDELEREEVFEGFAVDALGPRPVEVGDRLESADASVAETTVETALFALFLFDFDEPGEPGLAGEVVPTSDEAEEAEALDAVTK